MSENSGQIAALLAERRHYEIHGPKERIDEVNAVLASLGHGAKPKSKRAEKRPAKAERETR